MLKKAAEMAAEKLFDMKKKSTGNEGHADTIIRNHVVWSMGAGMIPVLVADIFAVTAIQLDMIRQMSKIYDVEFNELQGKAIVTSLTGSALARLAAGSVVKLLPVLGTFIGGATVSVFAGASTYALGEVFKKHFESGGTILDFDPDRVRKMYKEKFEKGKKVAKNWQKDAEPTDEAKEEGGFTIKEEPVVVSEPIKETAEAEKPEVVKKDERDVLSQLKDLAALKEAGAITDKEFKALKKNIMARLI